MVHIVWEFLVRADLLPEFEQSYSGAGGPWIELFGKSPGFHGTLLLRDTADPRHFLTIDSWESIVSQAAMREKFQDEYSTLDQSCAQLTESEKKIGIFEE